MVKGGWGSGTTFQASFGLAMDPEGIYEGTRILNAFRESYCMFGCQKIGTSRQLVAARHFGTADPHPAELILSPGSRRHIRPTQLHVSKKLDPPFSITSPD